MLIDFAYDAWHSGEPYNWLDCDRSHPHDLMDFHVDLGCGAHVKKGRIGIDRFAAPGVNIQMDLDSMRLERLPSWPNHDADKSLDEVFANLDYIQHKHPELWRPGLPFPDSSIESVISHHALEHLSHAGLVFLVNEVYRVLKPGGLFRAITPLFPSRTAVEDPDHKIYFMEDSWFPFCGFPDNHWMSSFSVPYSTARFSEVAKDCTPRVFLEQQWGPEDAREIRVTLEANK